MVNHSHELLSATFAALSDPTRRAMLERLAQGGASVTELAGPFSISLPAVSKHLRVLESAGLVARQRNGRVHRLDLMAGPLRDAALWIARYQRFWTGQLDSLVDYLDRFEPGGSSMARPTTSPETTLQIRRTLAAPRAAVFRAWTDPQALKRWFHPSAEFTTPEAEADVRVGGRYRVVMRSGTGELHIVTGAYRTVQPPERLEFTWAWEDNASAGETVVTIELLEQGSSTELVLTHQQFPSAESREKHLHGWNGCLEQLAQYL